MSQFFVDKGGSPLPDIETLTGDTGTNPVGPDGNFNINVLEDPDAPGVSTRGDAAANTLYIASNIASVCNIVQTVGATTEDLLTFTLGTPNRTYALRGLVAGFATTGEGIGGSIFSTFTTDGVTVTLLNTPDLVVNKSAALTDATFDFVASGDDVVLRVTGQAGFTIDWKGCLELIFAPG